MKFLAHRGLTKKSLEANSIAAFRRAWQAGFGIETDIRDYKGKLVISHDLANSSSPDFKKFLAWYKKEGRNSVLAINIKADGLAGLLKETLKKFSITNYFVFDMSVPDAWHYVKRNIKVFTRQSEFETTPSFYKQAKGVWLDELSQPWIDEKVVKKHLKQGKPVCIVSPELHQRPYQSAWCEYKKVLKDWDSPNLLLCTDYPEKAKIFFYA